MTFFIESNSSSAVILFSFMEKVTEVSCQVRILTYCPSVFFLLGLLPKYWPLNFDLKADMLLLHLGASLHKAQAVTANIAE